MSTHRMEYRIRYADTDAGGVVYNANYLKYFEIGRSEMMRETGFSYKQIEDRGFLLPVTESFSRYKAPARYDDLIIIETKMVEIKRLTCKFSYKISRDDGGVKPRLLVKGYTVHAAIDRSGKLQRLPDDIWQEVAKLQG